MVTEVTDKRFICSAGVGVAPVTRRPETSIGEHPILPATGKLNCSLALWAFAARQHPLCPTHYVQDAEVETRPSVHRTRTAYGDVLST